MISCLGERFGINCPIAISKFSKITSVTYPQSFNGGQYKSASGKLQKGGQSQISSFNGAMLITMNSMIIDSNQLCCNLEVMALAIA